MRVLCIIRKVSVVTVPCSIYVPILDVQLHTRKTLSYVMSSVYGHNNEHI